MRGSKGAIAPFITKLRSRSRQSAQGKRAPKRTGGEEERARAGGEGEGKLQGARGTQERIQEGRLPSEGRREGEKAGSRARGQAGQGGRR